MMKGNQELNSIREWTPKARQELRTIRRLLQEHKPLSYWDPSKEVYYTVMMGGNTINYKVQQGSDILWVGRQEFPKVLPASPLTRALKCLHKIRQECII